MNARWIVVVVALTLPACGPREVSPASGSTWVGTTTENGDVTTVVNKSGSVWGDVEIRDVLSLGVPAGADPYMFGQVRSVAVFRQRIYVTDFQLSILRVYERGTGAHLFDIGGQGEGPGELNTPWTMDVGPSGRVYAQDRRRVTVFEPDGGFVETWPYRGGPASSGGREIVVRNDGAVYVPTAWVVEGRRQSGYAVVSADGAEVGRVAAEPSDRTDWQLQAKNAISVAVPYSYAPYLGVLPGGEIVRGDSEDYRLELERPDGTTLVIERAIELPPVPDDQEQWLVAYWTHRMREEYDPGWTWNAHAVPNHKPAFRAVFGDRQHRMWVRRIVGTQRDPTCDPMEGGFESRRGFECWRDVQAFDVFDLKSGRFLGQVPIPRTATETQRPAFDQDDVFLVVEDEAGTVMVKCYRLVLSGKR